jgi:hypothetical protein
VLVLLFLIVATLLLFSRRQGTMAVTPENSSAPQAVYLPLVVNRFDASLGTPVFGVQVYGTSYVQQLSETGASWTRVPIRWRAIEPVKTTPPTYYWGVTDHVVQTLAGIPGMNVILTVDDNPDWAAEFGENGPHGPILASEMHRFSLFVQTAVERYDGDGFNDAPGSPMVRYWEFYNEPDNHALPWNVKWGPYPEKYADMLKNAHPAVKAASPQAQVVFGGIAYDWFIDEGGPFHREFLDRVLQSGAGPYFDVFNYHVYPAFGWGENGGIGLYEKSNFLRQKLAGYGLFKPMIITEAGWHSNSVSSGELPSSPDLQARYVVTLFTQSIAADVDVMIWWMLHDAGAPYPLHNGLIVNDATGTRKKSFYVYQHTVEQLSTTHYVRRLSTAETGSDKLEVHLFRDYTRNRDLYVAWQNPLDTDTSLPLSIPAGVTTVYTMLGGQKTVTDGDDGVLNGFVTLPVTGEPIFVEVSR